MSIPTPLNMEICSQAEGNDQANSREQLPGSTCFFPITGYTPDAQILAHVSSSLNQTYTIVGSPAAGGSNIVYKILLEKDKQTLCLRIPRFPENASPGKGTSLLRSLTEANPEVRAPRVVIQDRCYTLLTYIDGEPLKSWDNRQLTQERRRQLLDDLAVFLLSIWTLNLEKNQTLSYREWLQQEVDRGFRRALKIDSTWGDPIYYLYRRMGILALLPNDDDGSTAIKHGDLNAMNVIVNDKGLSGIIDWDTACSSPAPSAVQHPLFMANVPGWLEDVPENMAFEEDRAYLENAIGNLDNGAGSIRALLETSFERQFMELSLHNRRINQEYITRRLLGKEFDQKKILEELEDFLEKNPDMRGADGVEKLRGHLGAAT